MITTPNMTFIQSISQFISSGISYRHDEYRSSPYILSTSPPDSTMELYVLEHRLQVCSIPKNAINEFCHAVIKIALLPDSRPSFFSFTESNEQYTIIVTDEDFKQFPKVECLKTSGHPWRVLTISVGAMGASNELVGVSKISKSVIGPLADNKISVLCLSTYQSDYVLLRENQLGEAVKILSSYFKIFNEDHKRVTDTQVFSSSPKSPTLKIIRPICHKFFSPQPQYHVTGLDASKLSGVIQILLELMFFSGNSKDTKDVFFHFSEVCGDISLMLDNDAIEKFPNNVLYSRKNEETWRMVVIGEDDLGFDECGIVAQVVDPLAAAQVSTYYVSTFNLEYCMVLEKDIDRVIELLGNRTIENINSRTSADNVVNDKGVNFYDDAVNVSKTKEQCLSFGEVLSKSLNAQELQFSSSPQSPTSESSFGTSSASDIDSALYRDDDYKRDTYPTIFAVNTDNVLTSKLTSSELHVSEPIPIPPNETFIQAKSPL